MRSLARLPGALALTAALCGCRGSRQAAGHAGIPPAGWLRIVPDRVKEDARSADWQWTIIGDRNWRSVSEAGGAWRLSDSFPLNSPTGRGGTNIFILEASQTLTPAPGGDALETTLTLRGSNAARASQTQRTAARHGAALDLQALVTTDSRVRIPARVVLARAGGRPIILQADP